MRQVILGEFDDGTVFIEHLKQGNQATVGHPTLRVALSRKDSSMIGGRLIGIVRFKVMQVKKQRLRKSA